MGPSRWLPYLGESATSKDYRFYSVRDEFPGLKFVESSGQSILGELYEIRYEDLRTHLLPLEPSELELGVITLIDGEGSMAMVMRDEALNAPDIVDITHFGGWHKYTSSKQNQE